MKCFYVSKFYSIGFEDLGIIAIVISHLRKKLSIFELGISIEL
jgi:hypothetical protein